MTSKEFSNEFDVLLNSYKRFKDFDKQEFLDSVDFNEYEKSLFLTKAQEEIVIGLYTGKNPYGDSFEKEEEQRRYLSNLVVECNLYPIATTNGTLLGAESNSKFFTLPSDVWFITYESVAVSNPKCKNHDYIKVYPTRQDEYQVIRDNPFRGTNDRRALRLDLSDGVIEIICKYTVSRYYIRYIKKVSPIILEDLPNELTIDGVGLQSECMLHNALHHQIVDRAVRLALQSKGYNFKEQSNRDN